MKKILLVLIMGLCVILVLNSCTGNEAGGNGLTQNQVSDFCWNADFFDLNFDMVYLDKLINELMENNPDTTEAQLEEHVKYLVLSGAIRKNTELSKLNIKDMTPLIGFLREQEIEEIAEHERVYFDQIGVHKELV